MIAIKKGTRKINSSENFGPKRNKLKKSEPGKRKQLWKKDKKVTIVNQSIGKIRKVPTKLLPLLSHKNIGKLLINFYNKKKAETYR